jgi:hypothetical protein
VQNHKEKTMKTVFNTLMIISVAVILMGGFTLTGAIDHKDKSSVIPDESGKSCIQPSRIKNVDVLSNTTIVFHMFQDKSWVNTLPYSCPNLYHEGGFQYDRQAGKLCNTDIITVINTHIRCGLGTFKPYTKADAQKGS